MVDAQAPTSKGDAIADAPSTDIDCVCAHLIKSKEPKLVNMHRIETIMAHMRQSVTV